MSAKEQAAAAKARGNAAFTAKKWEEAVKEFTAAIELDPTDHVFFSNRSGAYASMNLYTKALADAESCIKIKPDWAKGYSRKGLAAFNLEDLPTAKAAYEKGLQLEPNNDQCKEGMSQIANAEKQAANPMGQLFGPSMWGKLQANPTTREYLKDPKFVQKCNMLQSNPNAFSSLAGDPQMSQALGVILGLGAEGFSKARGKDEDNEMADAEATPYDNMKKPETQKAPEKQPEKKPEPNEAESDDEMPALEEEITEEQKTANSNKILAVKEKEAGNKFYVKKDFTQALAHYAKAQELDPENGMYDSNESAVYYEQKEYEKCIATSTKAIQKITAKSGYDYSMIGKLYLRIAQAYDKEDKFDQAQEYAVKSRMEDGNDKAKAFEKALAVRKKKVEELKYLSKEKSEEAKAAGNASFAAQKWIEAIEHYSEALKRDPSNYRVYSNRAACYTKLMDWSRAMEDVEACLKIDPQFVKAYIRKGKIHHFLKQYHKALDAYQRGLDIDPACTDLIEGKRATMQAINQENQDGKVDPARAKEAMKDPEIQAILADPLIRDTLKKMQEDPATANRAMKDPTIRAKIEKLVAAGVLQIS